MKRPNRHDNPSKQARQRVGSCPDGWNNVPSNPGP